MLPLFGISIAKMVLLKIVVGGAGGNWRTINEILDPSVVRRNELRYYEPLVVRCC